MNKFASKENLDTRLVVFKDLTKGAFFLKNTEFFRNLRQKYGYDEFKYLIDMKKIKVDDEIIVFYEKIPNIYILRRSYNSNCGYLLKNKFDSQDFEDPISFLSNINWFMHREMGKLYFLDDYR